MPIRLLELVYEGNDVLDVALARQRRVLQSELGHGFMSLDLRRKSTKVRARLLRGAAERVPRHLLLRGLHKVDEAVPFFSTSTLFLDYLACNRAVLPEELARWAHRIERVFVYSTDADEGLRDAGIGRISVHAGPFLPTLETPLPEAPRLSVGVLDTRSGARDVLVRLKKLRKSQGWDMDIRTTVRFGGVITMDSVFEVAEESHLLIAPMEGEDYGGPHEGALLAIAANRALCTSSTSALHSMAFASTKRYIPAQKYEPGTYAASFGVYLRNRQKYDDAFSGLKADPEAVPRELLERM